MKFLLKQKGAVWLLPIILCLAAARPASADLLLRYDFEEVTEAGDVPNRAPGATTHGVLMNQDQTLITSGNVVTVGNTMYSLGKSLKLTPGAPGGEGPVNEGLAGYNAPHVDTGFILDELSITPTTDYTAMAWMNVAGQNGDNMIFGTAVDGAYLHLGTRGSNYHSGHYGDDLNTGTTTLNQWRHVTFVNEGATQTQSIYIDGVLIGSGATGAGSMDIGGALLIGSSSGSGSFYGILDEVKVFNSVLTQAEIQAEMIAGLPVYNLATLEFQRLSNTELTVTLQDSAISQVNPATVALTFDGVAIPADSVTVTKNGTLTTVVYNVALPQNSVRSWRITAADQNNTPLEYEGQVTSPWLPLSLPGPEGAVGSWGMRELRGTVIDGNRDLAHAVEIAMAAEEGTYVDATGVPVVNHSDPDNPGGKGSFNNDLPFIGNQPGDDNNVVMVAKTKVNIPEAGTWTFNVHSDDGFGMRVKGARFISTNGAGVVDQADPECLVHPAETGDSNTRGVCEFPAAGVYDIEFIAFEEGGGAYWEVSWARGAFVEEKESSWELVGNPNDPAVTAIPFTPRWLTPIPGPQGGDGTFGIRVYYQPPDVDQSSVAVPNNLTEALDFLRDTNRTPENDPESTFDRQDPFINHRDPGSSGGQTGLVGGELEFPPNTREDQPRVSQDRVVVTAHGRIRVTDPGDYTFQVRCDDGFLFRITKSDGTRPVFKRVSGLGTFQMSNPNEMFLEADTADADTRGIIYLDAGDYDIEFAMWEGGGGFWAELTYAKGAFPNSGDTSDWRLVGYGSNFGQLVRPGVSDAGWTVLASAPGGEQLNSLFDAALDIEADSTTSTWDSINFHDPQSGGPGSIPGDVPWPRDTPNDDDDYALSMSATLVIPVTGVYVFGFEGDDGSDLQIEGQEWLEIVHNATGQAMISPTGDGTANDRLVTDVPTGNSRTVGRIALEAGTYTIRSNFFERGGGSYFEIFGAQSPPVYYPGLPLPLLEKGAAGQPLDPGVTLPLVSASAPPPAGDLLVTNVTATGNPVTSVQITWGSEAGKTYLVEASTSLAADSWSVVADNVAATGVSTTADITLAPPFAGGQRVFFRVKEKP